MGACCISGSWALRLKKVLELASRDKFLAFSFVDQDMRMAVKDG